MRWCCGTSAVSSTSTGSRASRPPSRWRRDTSGSTRPPCPYRRPAMTADPTASRETTRPHLLLGGARVFLAESLLLPTGLILAAFLARRLGPGGYGLFAVTAAVIAWIEWSLTALFSRASVRFVADATRSESHRLHDRQLSSFPGHDRGTPARRTGDPDFGHARHPRFCRTPATVRGRYPCCSASPRRIGTFWSGSETSASGPWPRPRDGSAASCS